ncbi:E3 ubiquitin-protein ligase XB3-like isoform X2 [Curcuma longa]|uniref:E3 ubiquitin-protein ligase XB3-like isoform X2 n=1 Tax=Curcuma longa TaxID=136217 RepID=UPI003D9EBB70
MGQGVSCASSSYEHEFFTAVQAGDLAAVDCALRDDPSLQLRTTIYDRLSALHIAAANDRVQVLSLLLDRSASPDVVNRDKQTPLMLAAMHGKIKCLQKLLDSGANILMFDSGHGRTCLHYAAYNGHSDCLQAILLAAKSAQVTGSWGFARFVNLRDGSGATPLHLASRQRRSNCVHTLLDSGALVCASTGRYGTPLHLAARGGSLDCIRELLARGADRLQRDASGRLPYEVALKQNHAACAALLDPSAADPLVWPSSLKFISELNLEAKALLEAALMEGNRERELKILKATNQSSTSPARSDTASDDDISEDGDAELCSICFDRACAMELQDCKHQMCAHCVLALCCHSKPNPTTLCLPSPACPFCRSSISKLVIANAKDGEEHGDTSTHRKPRRTQNCIEASSSFRDLSSAMGSFGNIEITDSRDTLHQKMATESEV